jgi:TonB family protein
MKKASYFNFIAILALTSFCFTDTNKENLLNNEFQTSFSDSNEVFEVVEKMPEFPGGEDAMIKFISLNFVYPAEAKRHEITGRVLISFVINENGSISDIKPLLEENRWLGYGLEEEVMRVVRIMPDWIPGMQKGVPVKVQFILPVQCELSRGNTRKTRKERKIERRREIK